MNWSLQNTFYKNLPKDFFVENAPQNTKDPQLFLFNQNLATDLGLGSFEESKDLSILSGNSIPKNSKSLSMAYCGHQFGHFVRLGDGRAHLLGEQKSKIKNKLYDIQLKGSGKTPYSRGGDGKASIGPMIREYIISEAMHHLGVPTTRSLAVVSTGETVYRETDLPGAILTRVSESHIRVGSFECAATLNDKKPLKTLADYSIKRLYPEVKSYEEFFLAVLKRQAKLIAKWMSFGFIHGVMNTDNMSICGETIDYGPCAFLDEYNSNKVFSSIDHMGRYSYGNQPKMALWNLTRFAETLLPLFSNNSDESLELAKELLSNFSTCFEYEWIEQMSKKLGLNNLSKEEQIPLIQDLLNLMERNNSDFNNTFRDLSDHKTSDSTLYEDSDFITWKEKWESKINENSYDVMKENNPSILARNHLVEECIQEALIENTFEKTYRLLKALKNPFRSSEEFLDLTSEPKNSQKIKNTFCGT